MATQVLNFLWLNLDLPAPPDPPDGSIRTPLPDKYVENIRKAGEAHPETQVVLWVDSMRLTERQLEFLKHSIEEGQPNVHLKDLRSIPAYTEEPLYNEAEKDPHWRSGGQRSVIWRQVDAAKILISLQGDFDQAFFADLDHAHLDVASPEVQGMLEKRGLLIGSSSASAYSIENQLWGFTRSRRDFFETYYINALECAYRGENAWSDLVSKVDKELLKKESLELEEICLKISSDGPAADQPGHAFQGGYGGKSKPSLIDKGELTRVFNARSGAEQKPCPNLDVVWAPAERVYPPKRPAATIWTKLRDVLKLSAGSA